MRWLRVVAKRRKIQQNGIMSILTGNIRCAATIPDLEPERSVQCVRTDTHKGVLDDEHVGLDHWGYVVSWFADWDERLVITHHDSNVRLEHWVDTSSHP